MSRPITGSAAWKNPDFALVDCLVCIDLCWFEYGFGLGLSGCGHICRSLVAWVESIGFECTAAASIVN